MPNQDYDINPKQTENPKIPNRINPDLMPLISNLPKTIVGSSGGNVAPQINEHPQNVQFSMEDIKRMIEVNYMMRNYVEEIPTYPNNLLAPYYLTEYIKTKNVSVYTKNMLLALGEYVKNSVNKQPRRKDIIDFLARTVVSHNNRFPDVPMDQKDVESLISDVENFFSWTLENRYYDNVARNIYYDDVMDRVVEVAFEPENLELMAKLRKRPILEQEPESIIEVKDPTIFDEYRIPEYSQSEDEESLSEEVQEMSGSDVSVASQQIDEQPIAEVHQQVDMEQMALQEFAQDGQQNDVQPMAGAQQLIQNSMLTLQHFNNYINNHNDLSQQAKMDITNFGNYIHNMFQGKATRDYVVDWIVRNIALTSYYNNKPINNRPIQDLIDFIRAFFNWTTENHIYNNIASDISIDEIKDRATALLNDPSFIQKYEGIRTLGGTANTTSQQTAFLRVPSSAVNTPQLNKRFTAVYLKQTNRQPAFNKNWIDVYLEYLKNAKIDAQTNAKIKDKTLKIAQGVINMLMNHLNPKGKQQVQPTASNILDYFIVDEDKVANTTIRTYLYIYRELFNWTATEAQKKCIYYPNIIGENVHGIILKSVIGKLRDLYDDDQLDKKHPTLKYFAKFEQECPKKDNGTKDDNLENFIEFLQYELNLKEKPQEKQLVEGQPIFNRDWIDVYFEYFKNTKIDAQTDANIKDNTLKKIQSFITILMNYLSPAKSKQIQPTASDILDLFILYENKATDSTIKNYLNVYQELFSWTATEAQSESIYYPNIIGENVPETRILRNVMGKLRELYDQKQLDKPHPTLKYFEEFEQECHKNGDSTDGSTKDDNLENFIEFLQDKLHLKEKLRQRKPQRNNIYLGIPTEQPQQIANVSNFGMGIRLPTPPNMTIPHIAQFQPVMPTEQPQQTANVPNFGMGIRLPTPPNMTIPHIAQLQPVMPTEQPQQTANVPNLEMGIRLPTPPNLIIFQQMDEQSASVPPQQTEEQPRAEAQQPIQNGILTSQDFKDYINSEGLSQQAKNILQSFGNYINRSSGKVTREYVVDWIGHNVAYKNYCNPNNPMNDDQIQKVIDHIKAFFSWTERKLTYNNIAHDIVVEEVKNRANMLLNDPLTIREMQTTRSKSSKQQPATANVPNIGTNTKPPTIRPTIQPPKISPSTLKKLQRSLKRLQPQNRENPIPKVNLGAHGNSDMSSISQFTQLYDPLENLSNLSDLDRHTPIPDNNQNHEMNNNGIHQQVGNEPDPENGSTNFDYLYPELRTDSFLQDYDSQDDNYY